MSDMDTPQAHALNPENVQAKVLVEFKRTLNNTVSDEALAKLESSVAHDALVGRWVEVCSMFFLGRVEDEETAEVITYHTSVWGLLRAKVYTASAQWRWTHWLARNVLGTPAPRYATTKRVHHIQCPHLKGTPESLHLAFIAADHKAALQLAALITAVRVFRKNTQTVYTFSRDPETKRHMLELNKQLDRVLSTFDDAKEEA
jgi:hypothetical protein